nr:MAG TPA: hemolysin [Caudoviricetes sp.]
MQVTFSTEFWIQVVVYAVSFAAAWGSMTTRIKQLEQKVDKHNNVIERVYKVEESTKSAHHRIDEIKGGH